MKRPLVVHITGPACAGKSTLIREVQETYPGVPSWDVGGFYEAHGCIHPKTKQLMFGPTKKARKKLRGDLCDFLADGRRSGLDVMIVESSGINTTINELFAHPRMKPHIIEVCLMPEAEWIMVQRMTDDGLPVARLTQLNRKVAKAKKGELQLDYNHALQNVRVLVETADLREQLNLEGVL